MNYQIEKLKFIKNEDILNDNQKILNLKRINALINSIKNISDSTIKKILEEIQILNLSNFYEDIISAILSTENKSIELKMIVCFKLSKLEGFNEIFLSQLRQIMKENIKSRKIFFYTKLYAEICSSGIENAPKFERYITKTFKNLIFGNISLSLMYDLIIFFNSQIKNLENISEKFNQFYSNEISENIQFYNSNLKVLKEIFQKLENKNFDIKSRNLLYSFFSLKNDSKSFYQIINLSKDETKFYKILQIEISRSSKSQNLSEEEIIKNLKNTKFLAENLTKSQKSGSFFISLIHKTTELNYLAKLAAILDINFDSDFFCKFPCLREKNMENLQNPILSSKDERILLFCCELFKFHQFSRENLLFLFNSQMKFENYNILTKCLDRVGRFFLDKNYSQDGNEDIIKFIMCLEKKSNNFKKSYRKSIKNCIKRLFNDNNEINNNMERFFKLIFNDKNQLKKFLSQFSTLLLKNQKYFLNLIYKFCISSNPEILVDFWDSLKIDLEILKKLIIVSLENNEKKRSFILSEVYGIILSREKNEQEILNLSNFIETIILISTDPESKIELILNILNYLDKNDQLFFIQSLFEFVEMHKNLRIMAKFLNFCEQHNL